MGKTPQRVRGTQDIFDDDERRFARVVETFDRIRKVYRFRRVELPVFEATGVFTRSIGETTDIVSKEMYTFRDLNGESLTLRPEFTAGIARAFISEGWQHLVPLKIVTSGPVFRHERPQKGRYRQFHQIDAEIIGSAEPEADVELLLIANRLLKTLKVRGVTLQLNTLGDAVTRSRWRDGLVRHFNARRSDLSEESLSRLERNPLRILDSKDSGDQQVARDAPGIDDYLTREAAEFFERVRVGLEAEGVQYERNARLVRGLDYYRHTAFEFVTDRLGAQGTVLAGGRYDGLIESLGGAPTPGVGWAAGIERLGMLTGNLGKPIRTAAIVVETNDPKAVGLSREFERLLLGRGMPVMAFRDGGIRKRYEKARRAEPDYYLILETRGADGGLWLRVKRHIQDRPGTTGRVDVALRALMRDRYGISAERWHAATASGGEFELAA